MFGIVQFKYHHPRYPKTPLLTNRVQWYSCLERRPRTQTIVFGTVQFKHHHPRYPKTPVLPYGVRWYGCLERHPITQTICLVFCSSITTVLGIQKHLPGLWSTVVWVFGAPSQNPNNVFGIVQFKNPNPRYPKTPLLAYGVQWYGCSACHPRAQTIVFGIVQIKHFWHCADQTPPS